MSGNARLDYSGSSLVAAVEIHGIKKRANDVHKHAVALTTTSNKGADDG